MVLALEFWGPPFQFSLKVSTNLLIFVAQLVGIPQLGLQRHLASKGSPRLPRVPKAVARTSQVGPSGLTSPLLDGKLPIFMIILCKWQNRNRQNAKTRVGFGRTEVSVRLDCIVFYVLSFGHGPRNSGFQGFCKRLDFHVFFCFLHFVFWLWNRSCKI